MEIYTVTMEGVYRHEIRGIYTTEDGAKGAALRAISEEHDDYHCVSVGRSLADHYLSDVTEIHNYSRRGTKVYVSP